MSGAFLILETFDHRCKDNLHSEVHFTACNHDRVGLAHPTALIKLINMKKRVLLRFLNWITTRLLSAAGTHRATSGFEVSKTGIG